MLRYPVVTIIAFSCKIMITKTFFLCQHFLLFTVRTDCSSAICTELTPAAQKFSTGREKVVHLVDPTAESTSHAFD